MATLNPRIGGMLKWFRGQYIGIQIISAATALSMLAGVVLVGQRITTRIGEGGPNVAIGTEGAKVLGGELTPEEAAAAARAAAERAAAAARAREAEGGGGGGGGGGGPGGPFRLTQSDRGISADGKKIKVVFPWFTQAAGNEATGTATDIDDQEKSIRGYVDEINARGGVAGREIDPVIESYNPLASTASNEMREKCERWSNDMKVFAVVDGVGAWHSVNQACLANFETPLISQWTTHSSQAAEFDPYIWWTGPTAEDIVEHTILWLLNRKTLTRQNQGKFGIIWSNRQGVDDLTKERFEQVLAELNLDIYSETVSFFGSTDQEMAQAVKRMKDRELTHVINMLPFTTFASYLNHADTQQFWPQQILSDYESTMVVAEAQFGPAHPRALEGAIGPISMNLGAAQTQPSRWDDEERRCYDIFVEHNPEEPKPDRAGVAMRWCQGITAFAEAAEKATLANNGALTRINLATDGVSKIRDLPSAMTPTLSWARRDYAGTEWMKAVKVITPVSSQSCPAGNDDEGDGVCVVEIERFGKIRRLG